MIGRLLHHLGADDAPARSAYPDATRLSAHLTLGEMTRSQTALGLGIDNRVCDSTVLANLRTLAAAVFEPVRAFAGKPIRPSSGYRCEALNRAVGGSVTSQHVTGQAVDLEVAGLSNYDLAIWCAANLDFDQVILECHRSNDPASGWVHVGHRANGGNRREFLSFNPRTGYRQGFFA